MKNNSDKAWFDYCFEFKDGPYTAILEYKKAIRREIEKELVEITKGLNAESTLTAKYYNGGLIKALELIDTVSPE